MLLILYVGVNNHQDTTDGLTGTRLESVYGDVGQDGLFILWFNAMSESMLPNLTGRKLFGGAGQYGLFIL